MPGPDYLQFKSYMKNQRNDLQHSPKGTTWKKHKYIKKVNGRYVYDPIGGIKNHKPDPDALDKLNTMGDLEDAIKDVGLPKSLLSNIKRIDIMGYDPNSPLDNKFYYKDIKIIDTKNLEKTGEQVIDSVLKKINAMMNKPSYKKRFKNEKTV